MNQGWIKLHRKILDSAIWLDPLELRAFLWLLLSANHKPRKIYIRNLRAEITVEEGEIITSYRAWAEGIKYREPKRGNPWKTLSTQEMRTVRKHLEDAQIVTGVPTGGCLHLRIINWELYQLEHKKATEVPTEVPTGVQQSSNREQECKEYTLPSKGGEERPSDWAIELAKEFKAQLEETNNVPTRLPRGHIEQWALVLEKSHRLDKRPIDEIRAVALFPQQDPSGFWQKNFRTLRKLRDRSKSNPDLTLYDHLLAKCKEYGFLESHTEPEEMPDGSGRG